MDFSIPGEIRITVSQSIGSGETSFYYLCFYAKEAVTGTAYVAVSPESTLTNNDGTFLFSECTGLVDEADLDYVKELLFVGMTGAEQLTAEQLADPHSTAGLYGQDNDRNKNDFV